MRARLTPFLLVIAALALPAAMAAAVFYASDEAIGDSPGVLTPQFGGTTQQVVPQPATTAPRPHKPHRRRHHDSSGGATTGATTGTTTGADDHGGSTTSGGSGGGRRIRQLGRLGQRVGRRFRQRLGRRVRRRRARLRRRVGRWRRQLIAAIAKRLTIPFPAIARP